MLYALLIVNVPCPRCLLDIEPRGDSWDFYLTGRMGNVVQFVARLPTVRLMGDKGLGRLRIFGRVRLVCGGCACFACKA
jgi:hypothetical protein